MKLPQHTYSVTVPGLAPLFLKAASKPDLLDRLVDWLCQDATHEYVKSFLHSEALRDYLSQYVHLAVDRERSRV